MVQSALRQARPVKSTRQDAAVSTHVRRGKHSRARSDPIQYQAEVSACGSLGCVDGDSTRMVMRTRHSTVTGVSHSSHQPQTTKRTTSSSAKAAAEESAKTDIRTNLRPGNSVDYLKNSTVLLDWIIKPLPDIRGVCVEGQKLGMADYWHSAAIVEAVRPDVVVTATGSVYQLQGKINKYCTIDNGFPKDVATAFTKGFPRNWSDLIQDFYRQLEDSISIVAEISPLKGKQPHHHKLVKAVRKRKKPVSSQKLEAPDTVQDSIWTPAGLLKKKLSTDDVTVTRSGRISLPPLASWTGQCYRRIPNSSVIEVTFETDCAKKTLHSTTAQLLQLPKSSRKMIYNSSLSRSFQLPADTITKVIDRKLNQTVDVLTNIGECWPVATAGGNRKTALVAGRKISMKVKGFPSRADEGTRQGISQTDQKSADRVAASADIPVQSTSHKKSTDRVAASADIPVQSTSLKNNRSHNLTNSERPPAEIGPGDTLGAAQESGWHSCGVLTRGSMDAHTKTTLDKSLRVIVSRDLSADVNTQWQKFSQEPTRPLDTEPGSRSVRRSGRGVHKYISASSSSVDSDSTFLQSAGGTETGLHKKSYSKRPRESQTSQLLQADISNNIKTRLNKSYSKRPIESQTSQLLQADIRDRRSRKSTDSGSSEKHERHFLRQKKTVAKTRGKQTENKTSPANQSSVKSDRKSHSRPLSESVRQGLQADVKSTATVKASGTAKSKDLTTSNQAAAGKRKPVSTTRKRKHDADDDDVRDDMEGNHTIVERKQTKRRKVMDVTSSGDVSWSQQEKDLLHRALTEVSGADSSYWQKVSATVATRSQAECQQFYRQSLQSKTSKKPGAASSTSQKHQVKTGRKKGDPIRGGKGTLKRKQDLREFLQEQNEGYEDNLFEGTPFVNRCKQLSLFAVNVDKNDSEIFGVNHNCITPVAGTSTMSTPGTFLRAKMASVRKTPLSDHVTVLDDTPVTFNRRKADQYIKSFIDRQKKAEPGSAVAQNEQSVLDDLSLPVRSLFSPATDPSIVIDSHSTNTAQEDQDEEESSPYMYYWNDVS